MEPTTMSTSLQVKDLSSSFKRIHRIYRIYNINIKLTTHIYVFMNTPIIYLLYYYLLYISVSI